MTDCGAITGPGCDRGADRQARAVIAGADQQARAVIEQLEVRNYGDSTNVL